MRAEAAGAARAVTAAPHPLRLAVAGLGTVGAATLALLARHAGAARVVAVSARDRGRDRGFDLSGAAWFDDPAAMAREAECDAVVELIGGAEGPARATVEAALARGLPVVTANKALLAAHGTALARLAEGSGATIAYEAAVAGGVPVVKALREGLAGNSVRRVAGILNGTCNFVLTRMEADGLAFADALAEAQALGYAEADPTFDVGGFDAAHKLALLAALAFGTEVDADAVHVEGIGGVTPLDLRMAAELGYRVKLVAVAERTAEGVEARVHPAFVPLSAPLAGVMGVLNAVTIDADPVGQVTLIGPGAGGGATASAVVADVLDLARGSRSPVFGRPAAGLERAARAPMRHHAGGYYLRLSVRDRAGAFAAIAAGMADHGISLASIVQKGAAARAGQGSGQGSGPGSGQRTGGGAEAVVPVVLITHATTEDDVRAALEAVAARGALAGPPQVIRIERE